MDNRSAQYKIKLKIMEEEKDTIPFNPQTDVDLKNTFIKKINREDVDKMIKKYGHIRTVPNFNKYYFGIYFKINEIDYLGGILVYSDEYENNPETWEKYSFKNKILSLSVGLSEWWTPSNTASYFISKSYKIIKKDNKYKVLTDALDPKVMDIGIIYQSLNWFYLGDMKKEGESRVHILLNGEKYTINRFEEKFNVKGKNEIINKFPNCKILNDLNKKRYINFIGSKKENKKYKKEFIEIIKKYPTKNDIVEILINQSFLIYKLTNTINGKIYIGQTTRMLRHRLNEYRRHNKCNPILKNAIIKYGFDNFNCEIIEECNGLEHLNEREMYWIEKYNSTNKEIGYNFESGGNNSLSTEESRKKISNALKGRKQNPEWVAKRVPLKGSEEAKKCGRVKTEDQKKHLSNVTSGENGFWYGKSRSEDTINKIKETKAKQKDQILESNVQKIGVGKYDKVSGELLESYLSMKQAVKGLGVCYKTIYNRCHGITPQKGDFILKLLNNDDDENKVE